MIDDNLPEELRAPAAKAAEAVGELVRVIREMAKRHGGGDDTGALLALPAAHGGAFAVFTSAESLEVGLHGAHDRLKALGEFVRPRDQVGWVH